MLKKRLLTAAVLVPLFIGAVLKLSVPGFCLLTSVIVICSGWEWSLLMGVKRFPDSMFFPLLLIPMLYLALYCYIPMVLWGALLGWLVALVLICVYPRYTVLWRPVFIRVIMGLWVLLPCWLALNYLRSLNHGLALLLCLFILIWGADSGAYFAGRLWGKTQLAPAVSPGKTWQGLMGALVTTVIIVLSSLKLFAIPYNQWLGIMLLCLVTVLFSVVGDLFESMLKRREGLKDSGRLLPGHGGILDRIDSLTAAAPIFALGIDLLRTVY